VTPDSPTHAAELARFQEATTREASLSEPALAHMLSPEAVAFEPFRVLRAKIKAIGVERPFRCLGLVGAAEGEGTSTVCLGLAAALAQEGDRRVLLLEATLRSPQLASRLGLEAQPGLREWLEGPEYAPIPVHVIAPWGFHFLEAGGAAPTPAELLGSERMARLLLAARQRYHAIVVDCPALVPWSDSVVLQQYLDGLLLVVRARRTPRDSIRRAMTHVKPGLVRGIVFNDRHDVWAGRRRRERRLARP
jgi:polysaccharide biosynthesis transport protein